MAELLFKEGFSVYYSLACLSKTGAPMIRLIAFLGNAGDEYAGNRHNVAWMLAASMPEIASLAWQSKFNGSLASAELPSGRVCFLKPATFMNLSGDSVGPAMRFFKIGSGELLVVHDDLELGFGMIGFKRGGGLGGHNGLRSLEARLGTRDFNRFRIGIGRPDHADIAGYVLSDFNRDERKSLGERLLPAASTALALYLAEGFDAAIARYPKFDALADVGE
jgi:peptidyl-tRNA hydrolase, PTH1 family